MPIRVMVVFAHPDDAEHGCAGVIARWVRERGAVVRYVCVTSGERTSRAPAGWSPGRVAAVRESHARDAARIVGVSEVAFLRSPDGCVAADDTAVSRMKLLMDGFRPSLVLSHDPARLSAHPDHLAVGQAVFGAVGPAGPVLWAFRPDRPDMDIDITIDMRAKVRALVAHRLTVGEDRERIRDVIAACRRVGHRLGSRFGEEFRVVAAGDRAGTS